MITLAFARTMARYNQWQNRSLVTAASGLSDGDRWQDRGAFFGSIAQTLNHILWDDRIWMARLNSDRSTEARIAARHPYTETPHVWAEFVTERRALDAEIVTWADQLTETDLGRDITWQRGATEVTNSFGFNLAHMINHQTHHRGQVHAMLTAAGAQPAPTDLQMLPLLDDDT